MMTCKPSSGIPLSRTIDVSLCCGRYCLSDGEGLVAGYWVVAKSLRGLLARLHLDSIKKSTGVLFPSGAHSIRQGTMVLCPCGIVWVYCSKHKMLCTSFQQACLLLISAWVFSEWRMHGHPQSFQLLNSLWFLQWCFLHFCPKYRTTLHLEHCLRTWP